VENFLVVQSVAPRSAQRSRKPAQIRSPHRASPSSCTAAWPVRSAPRSFRLGGHQEISPVTQTNGKSAGWQAHAGRQAASSRKPVPKMKDPSGGTTGRVKPYGALGVDGRSRRIQPMGRDNRSHINKSQHPRRTFKTPADFFNPVLGAIAAKITAQRAISRRLRPICPTPSTAGSHSVPGSRKRYRQTDRAPAFFLHRACRKPRQAAPPARRSPR
jgi:hypothetical protein